MKTTICPQCRSSISADGRFCEVCGAPITGTSGAGATPPAAALPIRNSAAVMRQELRDRLQAATLGDYEIRGELGFGGMAAVYLAHHIRLNRRVAIKVMLPSLQFHDGMAERFLAEARTAAGLDHPGIIAIHSVEDRDNLLFLVMKLVDGASLGDVLRRTGALTSAAAHSILVQVGAALDCAHGEGVVHRDVKPANIMLDGRGTAIVTDFGIAKAAESETLTMTGALIGTPAYMSPEQFRGFKATAASDQYALGIVTYHVLTGEPPFTGTLLELQLAHLTAAPRPLLEARPDCAPALATTVMRMLAKEPGERFPSLAAAVESLGEGGLALDAMTRPQLAELVARTVVGSRVATPLTPVSPAVAAGGRGVRMTPVDAPRADGGLHAGAARSGERVAAIPVSQVRIAEAPRMLVPGESATVRADAYSDTGERLLDRRVQWSSSDPSLVEVSAGGVVVARRAGRATITATSEERHGTVMVEVAPATPVPGQGAPMDASSAATEVAPSVPTVAAPVGGWRRATALGGGLVVMGVLAVAGSRLLFAPAVVPPATTAAGPGAPVAPVVPAVAAPRPQRGDSVTPAPSATVARPPADVPPAAAGADSAVVRPPAVAPAETPARVSLRVAPQSLALEVGSSARLVPTYLVDGRRRAMDRPATWRVANGAVASVSATGDVTALAEGSTNITARLGDASTVIRVRVVLSEADSIEITIDQAHRRAGDASSTSTGEGLRSDTLWLRAQIYDKRKHEIRNAPVRWSSADPAIASVTERGAVISHGNGSTKISATSGLVEGSVTVKARLTQVPPSPAPPPAAGPVSRSPSEGDVRTAISPVATAINAWRSVTIDALYSAADGGGELRKRQFMTFLGENRPVSAHVMGVSVVGTAENSVRVRFTLSFDYRTPQGFTQQRLGVCEGVLGWNGSGWQLQKFWLVRAI